MISVEHVSKLYGNFVAVKDVSFSIGQGEIVGLLGHNGAGKTTIMKMLTGFLEPSSGSVSINGENLADASDVAQAQIGYLPESLPIYPEMQVMDYLFYCAGLRDIPEAEQARRIKYALDKTDLNDKALQNIATLSRGYKQRVGVAQALLHKPNVLILDEPTNGLDPHQTQQMRELILTLSKEATVILSTHIMQEVEALCHRVLIVNSGELAIDSSLEKLKNANTVHISTSASIDKVQALVEGADVQTLAQEDAIYRYAIALPEDNDLNTLCGQLNNRLVTAGETVNAIGKAHINLESLFNNLDKKGGAE